MAIYTLHTATGRTEEFLELKDARREAFHLVKINEGWLDDHTEHAALLIDKDGEPFERVSVRLEYRKLVFPLTADNPDWHSVEGLMEGLAGFNWRSYWGQQIKWYRLLPEEVVQDEGFDPGKYRSWKDFHVRTSGDLEYIEVWRTKRQVASFGSLGDRHHEYIPVGVTTDGRYRACTLIDVEEIRQLPELGEGL